jgi:hypothetical protein
MVISSDCIVRTLMPVEITGSGLDTTGSHIIIKMGDE